MVLCLESSLPGTCSQSLMAILPCLVSSLGCPGYLPFTWSTLYTVIKQTDHCINQCKHLLWVQNLCMLKPVKVVTLGPLVPLHNLISAFLLQFCAYSSSKRKQSHSGERHSIIQWQWNKNVSLYSGYIMLSGIQI